MYGVVPTLAAFLRIILRRVADARVCEFDGRSDRCGFLFTTNTEVYGQQQTLFS